MAAALYELELRASGPLPMLSGCGLPRRCCSIAAGAAGPCPAGRLRPNVHRATMRRNAAALRPSASLAVLDRAIFAASGGCGLNAKGFVSAMTGCAT